MILTHMKHFEGLKLCFCNLEKAKGVSNRVGQGVPLYLSCSIPLNKSSSCIPFAKNENKTLLTMMSNSGKLQLFFSNVQI